MTDMSVAFFLIPVKRFHTFKHCRLQLMRGNCSSRKIVEDLLEIPLQVLFKCFFDPDGSPSSSCIQTSTQDKHRVKVIRMNLGAIEQKHKYLLILSILSSSARKFVAATLSVPRKRVNLLEHSRVCQRVEVCVVENATSFQVKVSSHMAAATSLQERNSKALDKSSVLQFPHSHLPHLEEFRGETRQLLQLLSVQQTMNKENFMHVTIIVACIEN